MVFCRGCGKEIHDTANSCPHCGALQAVVENSSPTASAPISHVDNTLVWVLAFAPIIGGLLEIALAYAVHGSQYRAEKAIASGYYFWVTVVLNIVLCIFDEKKLKGAGINTDPFGPVFLVPVYLFKRAKILRHHPPAYFITWIVCFALIILF